MVIEFFLIQFYKTSAPFWCRCFTYAFFLNKFAILNASPPQMTTIPITIIIIADPLIMKHLDLSILFKFGRVRMNLCIPFFQTNDYCNYEECCCYRPTIRYNKLSRIISIVLLIFWIVPSISIYPNISGVITSKLTLQNVPNLISDTKFA